jgi:hypothetical protein
MYGFCEDGDEISGFVISVEVVGEEKRHKNMGL